MEEKKVRNNNVKKKEEISVKSILKEYINYYKKELKFKHVVIFLIMIIFFILSLNMLMGSQRTDTIVSAATERLANDTYFSSLTNKLLLNFILILAGFTPYVYISVLGVAQGYMLALNVASSYMVNNSIGQVIFLCVGALIQIFAFSLAISTGMNYCSYSNKRSKFNKSTGYSVLNVKKQMYEMRDDQEGAQKVVKEMEKREKNRQKYNVKVPYKMFVVSFCISSLLIIIGNIILK